MLPLFHAVGTSGIILCLRFLHVVVTTWALHSECVPSHSFTCLTSGSDDILLLKTRYQLFGTFACIPNICYLYATFSYAINNFGKMADH